MTNGHIDDAEVDALLSGDQRKVDRYLVTGIRELKRGQAETRSEVKAMREVCEVRGRVCPGMHASIADPVGSVRPPAPHSYAQDFEDAADSRQEYAADAIERDNERKLRQRVWALWGVGVFLAVTIANALVTYGLDKALRP